MKSIIIALISTLFISPSLQGASDTALEKALRAANTGNTTDAIKKLEKLKSSYPNDARVAKSLGLLYQSTDQFDKAITELERANGMSSSTDVSYALGLLYESKILGESSPTWKNKAKEAWQKFLSQAPANHPRRQTAERHLDNLSQ